MKNKKVTIFGALLPFVLIPTTAPAQDCGWVYSGVVGSPGSNYYGYRREKRTFTYAGEWSVACCPAGCTPETRPSLNSGSLSVTRTIEETKTWSGAISGTLNWMWNILVGTPFHNTTGGSAKTTTTLTAALGSSVVYCSQKLVAFRVDVVVEEYERNTGVINGQTKSETRTRVKTDAPMSFTAHLIGTNQSINPCTNEVTGDTCTILGCTSQSGSD